MNEDRKIGLLSSNIDFTTVFIYIALVLMGWFSIYAAVYNDDHRSIFDLSQRYGVQIIWIVLSFVTAISILLIDSKYYHMFSYHFYWLMLALMVGVMLFGREVNGAKSWVGIGGFGIQPVEFMKIATGLALARFMSSYDFNMKHRRTLFYVGAIIFVPVFIILLQNDTGSALVFFGFFIVLYREGFGAAIYVVCAIFGLIGVLSFFLEPFPLVVLVFLMAIIAEAISSRKVTSLLRYTAIVAILVVFVEAVRYWLNLPSDLLISTFISIGLTLPVVIAYSLRGASRTALIYFGLFVMGAAMIFVVDYAFDNVLQPHQQVRILDLLGIENDPQGSGYNAMQSKIAIGSGGVLGKGFLQGTQTRFSFVPEQSTDFIFCTVGEEWGFVGSMVVVLLFGWLIFRLMRMGERQKEPFARIYCYSVAAILFMHFLINIMMTIGIFPIVGIPLPFFSYGGSSLLAFTVLLFIAIRLDSSQWEGTSRRLL